MKKLFFYLITFTILMTACHEEPRNSFNLQINDLEGEWVYDHPEEGIWEVQKFLPSGVFYYSNKVTGDWKFQNYKNDGRYWIDDGNKVTCQYSLNGVAMQIKMTVLNISQYSYTAEYNDGAILGNFTYAKLLSKIELKPGETSSPNYDELVKCHINGFKSHNSDIVTVDDNGFLKANRVGHTYIDVMTEEGTAVIEIIVFDRDNMFGDYSFAFGKTIPEIVEIVGDNYSYRKDNNGLAYYLDDYLTDELYFITGTYDTSHVEFVQLILNDNISKSVLISYLDNKYTRLSESEGIYNYVTEQSVNNNPIALIYDSNESKLTFMILAPMDRWVDFSYLFGQTDNIIYKEMTECGYPYLFSDYTYSKDGSDYYEINDNNDASLVGFVFNSENKMCEYWVYLYDDYMNYAQDILNWLKNKYIISTKETTNSQYVFYDKGNRMRIVFDASGYVSYTDTMQKPFTPASRSIPKIDHRQSNRVIKKDKSINKYCNLRIPVFIKD